MAEPNDNREHAESSSPVGSASSASFEGFFHTSYRVLLKTAMYAGATKEEAEDSVASVMEEILRRWAQVSDPLAYARRAVVSNFLKEKTRTRRISQRLIECGEITSKRGRGLGKDSQLTLWEDRQWVMQLLDSLPPAQRDVMAYIVDDFRPAEVARLLGKNPDAVRQNLHAARQRLMLTLNPQFADRQDRHSPPSSLREEADERQR